MGVIVKPGDAAEPAKTVSTQREHLNELMRTREAVAEIVTRMDKENLWDVIQAKDVPPEIVAHVADQLEQGLRPDFIRRNMGIARSTDKSWKKIMAAMRGGLRIDGTAFLQQQAYRFEAISIKMHSQIMDAFKDGVAQLDADGNVVMLKGPSKELAQTIDAYSRLQQGFVKLGKDLGAFVEGAGEGGKGGGGVTIVVKNHVPFPAETEIKAHQEKMGKTQTLVIEGPSAKKP